ncbi:hypothetical protein GX48_03728 [Paracoccidioides brasiliensis]|nr:hypothetical protein GX48_03728 [Paracoccidioides brasiliensis]
MNDRERPWGLPSNGPGPKERWPLVDACNGSGTNPGAAGMSRAEKFEHEKRRLIQSCFAKQDADGSIIESYITHIRITEDAAYPSSPPPPDSPPENKKPRLVIVSVRKSGRVRLHKARENSDGSFSVGKTWMLDDLTRIQIYEHMPASNPSEQQQKMWASNLGFVVTVSKPYYWQAASPKERDFFIGSLVKIYKKYTGGKVPELLGFDPRDRDVITGAASPGQQAGPLMGPRDSPMGPRDPPPGRSGGLGQQSISPQTQSNLSQPPYAAGRLPGRDGLRELGWQPSREQFPSNPPGQDEGQRLRPQFPPSNHPQPRGFRGELRGEPPLKPVEHTIPNDPSTLSPLHAGPAPRMPPVGVAPSPNPLSTSMGNQHRTKFNNENGIRPARAPAPSGKVSPIESSKQAAPDSELNFDLEGPVKHTIEAARNSPLEEDESPIVPEPLDLPKILSSSITPATPAEPTAASSTEAEAETHRPGLGPMVKKKQTKDVASSLRRAANAYGAFFPRAGGAADRLLAKEKSGAEPDNVTGVISAPLSRTMTDESTKTTATSTESSIKDAEPIVTPKEMATVQEAPRIHEVAKVQVSEPASYNPPQPSNKSAASANDNPGVAPSKTAPSQAERRRQRRKDNTAQYCTALAIDPSILEGRGGYFDDILSDLGWDGKLSEDKRIEDLEADVRREIGRVQASSWLGHLELQEGKVDQLAKLFDKTIAECDELDGLLMLYAHELNTLADDVAYIEAQSQGLQVQTANQKLLQNELQNLLKTISISSTDLSALREASLSNPDGIQETESSLAILYKAMATIDPDIGINKKRLADAAGDRGVLGVYADTEIGQMRAVKEKTVDYRNEVQLFLQRLKQYMSLAFRIAEQKMMDSIANSKSEKLILGAHDHARQELWMYSSLMLFAREVSPPDWSAITTQYEQQMKKPYQNEFRDNILAWKREARQPTGDEQELLFTHQEKERDGDGITTAARKLTVRRGKTVRVAGNPRAPGPDNNGKIEPYEVFGGSLEDTTKLIAEEQNFVVKFFHLNSLSNIEFPDLVAAARPEDRRPPIFSVNELYDPDRDMAKKVEQIMDEIFSPWTSDMQSLAGWASRAEPLQGVGVLFALERKISAFDETSQEFIVRNLQKIHSHFMGLFNRFVEEQIRAIEETKVKVKKRKGVISFMRTFPNFSATIENMISLSTQETLDIRLCVNEAYEKIIRAMWDSLKFIAKEAPGQQTVSSGGAQDPEDKEALNYHILLIENMNHYLEEVDCRDNLVLTEWKDRATHDLQEHLRLYIDAVIRRPLGKLLDFIESTESLLQTAATPTDIALRTSHSRILVKKLLTSFDAKELRRGIDALKKRIEKHFGDADDPGVSRSLVVKVLKECESRYSDVHDRSRRIIELVYEGQVELEWRKEEAASMFKR